VVKKTVAEASSVKEKAVEANPTKAARAITVAKKERKEAIVAAIKRVARNGIVRTGALSLCDMNCL
jgi:hypothetical protein